MTINHIKDVSAWMNNNASVLQFGEIAVTFIIHDGKIKRVIKTVTESELKD